MSVPPDASYGGPSLGGGLQGISSKQTVNNFKDSDATSVRNILRNSWNGMNGRRVQLGANNIVYKRRATPFRAVMNMDDFLCRKNYVCGGPNPTNASKPGYKRLIGNVMSQCDATGIQGASCNPKFVADSSDYVKFRKQNAVNKTYNDSSFGGDAHHGSYVSYMMAIHHH